MRHARAILGLLVALWLAVIISTPYFATAGGAAASVAGASYQFFSGVCHQFDAHCWHVAGQPFPVCARCLSIYGGFAVGIWIAPLLRRIVRRAGGNLRILMWASLPMIADAGCSLFGIHEATSATRLVTGVMFGMGVSIILEPIIVEMLASITPPVSSHATIEYHATETR